MTKSEHNFWPRIRLAASLAATLTSFLKDALRKEEELKLQLKKAYDEEELNLQLKRKLENKSLKRKLEIKQERKEDNDFEIKKERKEYNGFEIKQEHKEYNDFEIKERKEYNKSEIKQERKEYNDFEIKQERKEFNVAANDTLKIEECTRAIARNKEEIKACKERLKFQKAEVERLRGKLNQAEENEKSQLNNFGCTGCIKIMSPHDLTPLMTLMDMKPTKPFKFTLGSNIPNGMVMAIKEIAHEIGLPALQFGSVYEWDGVSCKSVGPH